MQLQDFRDEVNTRLERIEEKLDAYNHKSITNEADLSWIKGFLKFGSALLASVIGTIITYLIKGNS